MINSDYEKAVKIEKDSLDWKKDKSTNIYKKVLSKDGNKETSFIKINKDSNYTNSKEINSVEILVLEGIYSNEFGNFIEGTYLKLPIENENKIKCNDKCKIFKKINYEQIENEKIIIDTNKQIWNQGQGRLQVKPLSNQTALVYWPKDEKFIPHKHWGGEEIVVLRGTFMDEHGKYKKGTWIRSPHLSEHYPYVEEETIIFVKTGHM